MASDLRFETWYAHAPEKVWRAITDSELLSAWLLPNDFAPRRGHFFTLRTRPQAGFDGVVHGEVMECEAPRRLSYKWTAGGLSTRVFWSLAPHPSGGTDVVVEHEGFVGM